MSQTAAVETEQAKSRVSAAVPEIVSPSAQLMGVISQAVSNENFDPAKLEHLLDIQTKWQEREALQAYAQAFARMQPNLPEVKKLATATIKSRDNGPSHSYSYARFSDVITAIKPVLQEHGFGLSHSVNTESESVKVKATLWHEGGHCESTVIDLPHDKTGSKNSIQAVGSSIEYGRKYSTWSLLGLATAEDDTDAGPVDDNSPYISKEQAETLRAEMKKAGVSETQLCQKIQTDNIECLEKGRFQGAMRFLKKRQQEKKQ